MASLATEFDNAVETAKNEQSKDQATLPADKAEPVAATVTVEEKGAEPAQPLESSEQLLPQEEWNRLKDPEEKLKALNKAWTEKTQQLAEQRKSLEPMQQLAEALESDPKEALRLLTAQYGLTVAEPATKAEAKTVADDAINDLKQALGPDLEFLAERLAPAIEKLILKTATQAISKEVDPLKQQAKEQLEKNVSQEVNASIESFTKKHPDWKQYETKMSEVGSWLQPVNDPKTGKSPTTDEYMEILYLVATKDVREAEIAKSTITRMRESAEKSETPPGGVSANRVAKSAPKFANWNEAFENASSDGKAGIIYD